MPDHVHLVVALTPSDRVSDAVRYFKGTAAGLLRNKFQPVRDVNANF